jgi:hypothetical protein
MEIAGIKNFLKSPFGGYKGLRKANNRREVLNKINDFG